MKRLLITALSLAVLAPSAGAQRYLKFNGLTALVAVPSVGIERQIRERVTFQIDATASLWRSVGHAPMQFLIVIPEWRYHPHGTTGVYVGAHLGASFFRLQKWNYRGTDLYQEGAGLLLGGTVGYQRPVGERWMIDLFGGGGTSQALYKGYNLKTGQRYDGARLWNISGEWLPYRGGVMLAYRLGTSDGKR